MSANVSEKAGGPLEVEHDEKSMKGEPVLAGDYSGAAEKTDPVEIALVRKLDRRIMVSNSTDPMKSFKTWMAC